MTIQFECPACRTSVESEDHTRGVMISCPGCRQLVKVPRATAVVEAPVCGNCLRPLPADEDYCEACGFAAGARRFEDAGFWWRLLALLIDVLVLTVPAGLCIAMASPLLFSLSARDPERARQLVRLFGVLVGWLYAALMESSPWQATIGKAVLGLKVTNLHGERISFGVATARHFGKILSSMLCMVGFVMAGLTAQKQALHDMLAGTLVVRNQDGRGVAGRP